MFSNEMLNTKMDVVLSYNGFGLGEVPLLQT